MLRGLPLHGFRVQGHLLSIRSRTIFCMGFCQEGTSHLSRHFRLQFGLDVWSLRVGVCVSTTSDHEQVPWSRAMRDLAGSFPNAVLRCKP